MPERRILVPAVHGGISQQPPHLRYPNQVGAAENMVFSVADGASPRRGTRWLGSISDLPAGADVRLHTIVRDEHEHYLVMYGDGILRVFNIDTTTKAINECTVTVDRVVWPYLNANAANSKDLRLVTIADATLIANRTVPVDVTSPLEYAPLITKPDLLTRDYGTLTSIVPQSPDTTLVVQTREASLGEPAGFWAFKEYDESWGCINTVTLGADWITANKFWSEPLKNPAGFNIAFGTFEILSALGSWNPGTLRLTIVGAFAGYDFVPGDMIKITGGTGVTVGWQPISGKIDNDTITLFNSIAAGSPTNVSVDGLGQELVDVQWDASDGVATDMHDIAAKIEAALRNAGATDATCAFIEPTYFRIGSTHRGTGARVYAPTSPTSASIYDMTLATRPFQPTVSAYVGTGGVPEDPTDTPANRWSRIANPNDTTADLDRATMPVRMIRSVPPGISEGAWTKAVLASDPWVFYNFDEPLGFTVDNITGIAARDGTITTVGAGTATLDQTGTIQETGSKAISFVSGNTLADLAFVEVGGTDSLYPDEAWTFEFVVKRSAAPSQCMLARIQSAISAVDVRVESNGSVKVNVAVPTGYLTGTKVSPFATNTWFHIVAVWDPTGATNNDKIKIYMNGTLQTGLSFANTLSPPPNWGGALQMRVNGPDSGQPGITGLFDAFAWYDRALTAEEIETHFDAISVAGGGSPTLGEFHVTQIEWTPRTAGSEASNPVPSLWQNNVPVSDIAIHRDRLVLGGDVYVVMSAAGDLFNFFLDDPSNLVDSDPIDLTLGAEEISLVQSIVPYRRTIATFTHAGRQFELTSPDVLNQASTSLQPSTSLPTEDVKPVAHGNIMRFIGSNGPWAKVHEYIFDDLSVATIATELTEHVPKLVTAGVGSIRAHPNLGLLFVRPDDADNDTLYVHRSRFAGTQRTQSAWSKWTFDDVHIVDTAIVGDDLWFVFDHEGEYSFECLPLTEFEAPPGFPYDALVDHQYVAVGVFAAGITTWTMPFSDTGRDAIVLGDAFGADAGLLIVPDTVDEFTVTKSGDCSAGAVIIGRRIAASMPLTRPFVRDREGTARPGDVLSHRRVVVTHRNAGCYRVRGIMPNRVDRIKNFDCPNYGLEEDGTLNAWMPGDASKLELVIESIDARPFTIVTLEHFCDHEPRPA